MTTEHKAEMVASMIESIVKFGLTPSEIDVFINALDDLRDSLDTNLHEKLKEAMASPIARVIADPRDTQIRELTAERDALRREAEAGKQAAQIGLDTLIAMRDADYRGNRPTSSESAFHAVKAINKALEGESK